MEKYMGNKSKFCNSIFDEINKVYPIRKGQWLFEPFSGTTNVSRYFKSKGLNIICNDINDFSKVLGRAYIENCCFPRFAGLLNESTDASKRIHNAIKDKKFSFFREKLINDNMNTSNIKLLKKKEAVEYLNVLTYLTYYSSIQDYPEDYENLFFDYYCENGSNSKYINLVQQKTLVGIRNKAKDNYVIQLIEEFLDYPHDVSKIVLLEEYLNKIGDLNSLTKVKKIIERNNLVGNRMFFSENHGKRLDIIYNTVCFWKNKSYISDLEYNILLTSIIETVTIFSNTSATYQAFYKDYRMNTQQEFRLILASKKLDR